MKAKKRKCQYCGSQSYSEPVCSNCKKKHQKVHELWLLCQEIKKFFESEDQNDA